MAKPGLFFIYSYYFYSYNIVLAGKYIEELNLLYVNKKKIHLSRLETNPEDLKKYKNNWNHVFKKLIN